MHETRRFTRDMDDGTRSSQVVAACLVSREGLAGMEVVEVSPPYDVADVTALLASRVIMDVLGKLVLSRKLGRNSPVPEEGQQQTDDEV